MLLDIIKTLPESEIAAQNDDGWFKIVFNGTNWELYFCPNHQFRIANIG